ncbi:MAG TPA: Rne/Rng family ribonuclease [Jatrophihabitans sp.]|nr:Rne/Rng family ribonuclease [Jatrophihabitans sp.]
MLEPDDTTSTSTEPQAAPAGPAEAPTDAPTAPAPRKRAPRKRAAAAAAGPGSEPSDSAASADAPAPRKRAPRKATKKAAAPAPETTPETAAEAAPDRAPEAPAAPAAEAPAPAEAAQPDPAPAKRTPRKRAAKKAAPKSEPADTSEPADAPPEAAAADTASTAPAAPAVLFQAPIPEPAPAEADIATAEDAEDLTAEPEDVREAASEQATGARRRRRRGRRGRGGSSKATESSEDDTPADAAAGTGDAETEESGKPEAGTAAAEQGGEEQPSSGTRRRRRRRRSDSAEDDGAGEEPANTVTHVREPRSAKAATDDGVKGVKGSTRLEAKRQRRRDGRETTRRRAPILTEAEFLARREAVDRVMAVRQNGDRTQVAVLEDGVLVEHYVTRASSTSYVGNVYLGRVQNVLPSMEAAFVDIGKGRNGVLYAGEVNWDAAGLEGKSRTIEQALKSGDTVLVQVTKDPIGHKGARLTSQVSLPGRFLVFVPGGGMTGISRRLPDTERHRLKAILKKIVPEDAGVIVRTAAEGASEEDLRHDVERLTAQWEAIQKKANQTQSKKSAPTLLHGEPDLATRVVRDVFNEDFKSLIVQGDAAWGTVSEYIGDVAPDLRERLTKHTKETDLFHDLRVDEQLMKALDRKVWLPSGGSLVIDRTEAMTVIDVNTGKFVGAGGNLEQTVTRNNLEAAEEIVRQLRLRDVGGIVVIDFIDMVLESNRDLVLRRLTECLGRDRTKHQVAEVTSLGLVQMTRKRVGEGLLEAFSEPCEACHGRGVIVHGEPVDHAEHAAAGEPEKSKSRRRRGSKAASGPVEAVVEPPATDEQRQAANAAIAAIHRAASADQDKPADGAEIALVDQLATGLVAAARDAEAAAETPAPEPAETGSSSADAGDSSETEAEEPAPAKGRRRRRAASRPAGPPVAVG